MSIDELKEKILEAGKVSASVWSVTAKMYDDGYIEDYTSTAQQLVEIPVDDLMQTIKQALYKDMVEIIGENEELKSKYIKKDDEIFMANRLVFRNQLRQELRTKLKGYYGVKE